MQFLKGKAGLVLLPAFSFSGPHAYVASLLLLSLLAVSAHGQATPEPASMEYVASSATLHLTLQDCIDIAVEKNLGLRSGRDSLELSESALAIQEGAFDPILYLGYLGSIYNSHLVQDYTNEVDLTLNMNHEYGGSFSLTSGLAYTEHRSDYLFSDSVSSVYSEDYWTSRSEFTTTVGAAVSQQFLKGGLKDAATASLRAAQFDVSISKLDLESLTLDLALSVKHRFFAVLKAQEQLKVLKSSLAAARHDLQIAKLRLTEGLASRLDHSRAELVLINRERDLNNASKQVKSAIDDLVALMGLEIGQEVWPVFTLREDRVPIETEDWIATAWRNRPDLRAVRVQQERYEVAEETARNNMLPSLEAEGKFTMSETDDKFREPLDVTERVWEFNLRFEHGFFDTSDDEALRQTRIASRQLARSMEDQKRQIALSIRETSRELKKLAEEIEYLRRAEAVAAEQLELSRLSYQEGLITNRDLITAENDYTAARILHINAMYDYQTTLAELEHALGR